MATICTDAGTHRSDFSWPVQVLIGLGVTSALSVGAYLFLDQPVMAFVRGHDLQRYRFLKWLTRPPEVFCIVSVPVVLVGYVRRWFAPWTPAERVAVTAAVSTLSTALAAGCLKISFGRSFDGFYPFHVDSAYWLFPSGHTACTLSVAVVAEAVVPRWRWCWYSVVVIVAMAMIALGYHFVGDIFAGAFLGWAVSGTVARWFRIKIYITVRDSAAH